VNNPYNLERLEPEAPFASALFLAAEQFEFGKIHQYDHRKSLYRPPTVLADGSYVSKFEWLSLILGVRTIKSEEGIIQVSVMPDEAFYAFQEYVSEKILGEKSHRATAFDDEIQGGRGNPKNNSLWLGYIKAYFWPISESERAHDRTHLLAMLLHPKETQEVYSLVAELGWDLRELSDSDFQRKYMLTREKVQDRISRIPGLYTNSLDLAVTLIDHVSEDLNALKTYSSGSASLNRLIELDCYDHITTGTVTMYEYLCLALRGVPLQKEEIDLIEKHVLHGISRVIYKLSDGPKPGSEGPPDRYLYNKLFGKTAEPILLTGLALLGLTQGQRRTP